MSLETTTPASEEVSLESFRLSQHGKIVNYSWLTKYYFNSLNTEGRLDKESEAKGFKKRLRYGMMICKISAELAAAYGIRPVFAKLLQNAIELMPSLHDKPIPIYDRKKTDRAGGYPSLFGMIPYIREGKVGPNAPDEYILVTQEEFETAKTNEDKFLNSLGFDNSWDAVEFSVIY